MPEHFQTDDLRIKGMRPLVPPAILLEEIPAKPEGQQLVATTRSEISDALHGKDDRLVVVCGPCSIHHIEGALDYASRLVKLRERFNDELILVMRTYFEKPRTVAGWKGLMNDPDLDETYKINKGLRIARQLLSDLTDMKMPAACEFLDNILPQYIADFVSWVAIGARTTESQIHREFASGCSMPVGFKNNTSGRPDTAIDAIRAAALSHWFPSVTKQGLSAILQTSGNDSCHIILRGGSETGPNYDEASVLDVVSKLDELGLPPRVMVDCSHGNCCKDYRKQKIAAESLADQISGGSKSVFGVMIESNIREGRQDFIPGSELEYGLSITDGCISIEETEQMLELFASSVRSRSKVQA